MAGLTGAFFGMVLAWAVSRYVFEIPWTYSPLLHVLGLAATTALVILVGAFSSFDILNRKPLGVLRTQ